MKSRLKGAILFITSAFALSLTANAQFVHYQDVPQSLPSYSGIGPSRSSSYSGYNNYNYTPVPQPQKEVKQVTLYKVDNNGNLSKTLGKIEISSNGAFLISVRNNGSWWGTRGTVYAISERDPLYQYFNYQVRSADGTLFLF